MVTAAGKGARFESERPKQYMPLLGVPVLERTLRALSGCPEVDALMVVVDQAYVAEVTGQIAENGLEKVVGVTAGADHRALSVRNGLGALANVGTWDLVGVHDGARPLVTQGEVGRAVAMLTVDIDAVGVVVAVPSVDTVKQVDSEGNIVATPDREMLWRAQTPQIFRWAALMAAYEQPDEVLLAATDDSALVEASGGMVKVVRGSSENLKITDRADFRLAESILKERGNE